MKECVNENRMNKSEENAVTIFLKKMMCIVVVAGMVWKNKELYMAFPKFCLHFPHQDSCTVFLKDFFAKTAKNAFCKDFIL